VFLFQATIDDSSTSGETDKFFKYVTCCTLLFITNSFFLATFLFGVFAGFISAKQGDL
jgi:hypothetical protein